MPPTKATLAAQAGSWGLRSGLQSASFSFSINMGRSHTENSLSLPAWHLLLPVPVTLLDRFQAWEAAQVFV